MKEKLESEGIVREAADKVTSITKRREPDILTVYTGINSDKPIKLEESDKYVDFFEPGLFHPETEDMGDLDLDKKNLDLQKTGVDLSLKDFLLAELGLDLNSKDLDFDKRNSDISREKNLDHSNRKTASNFEY